MVKVLERDAGDECSGKPGGQGSFLVSLALYSLDRLGGHWLGDLPSHPLCQPPASTQDAGQRGQALCDGICLGCYL